MVSVGNAPINCAISDRPQKHLLSKVIVLKRCCIDDDHCEIMRTKEPRPRAENEDEEPTKEPGTKEPGLV